jgi:hypothetical protein
MPLSSLVHQNPKNGRRFIDPEDEGSPFDERNRGGFRAFMKHLRDEPGMMDELMDVEVTRARQYYWPAHAAVAGLIIRHAAALPADTFAWFAGEVLARGGPSAVLGWRGLSQRSMVPMGGIKPDHLDCLRKMGAPIDDPPFDDAAFWHMAYHLPADCQTHRGVGRFMAGLSPHEWLHHCAPGRSRFSNDRNPLALQVLDLGDDGMEKLKVWCRAGLSPDQMVFALLPGQPTRPVFGLIDTWKDLQPSAYRPLEDHSVTLLQALLDALLVDGDKYGYRLGNEDWQGLGGLALALIEAGADLDFTPSPRLPSPAFLLETGLEQGPGSLWSGAALDAWNGLAAFRDRLVMEKALPGNPGDRKSPRL